MTPRSLFSFSLLTVTMKTSKDKKTELQNKMVKDSLTTAFDELYAGKAHKNARNFFSVMLDLQSDTCSYQDL